MVKMNPIESFILLRYITLTHTLLLYVLHTTAVSHDFFFISPLFVEFEERGLSADMNTYLEVPVLALSHQSQSSHA